MRALLCSLWLAFAAPHAPAHPGYCQIEIINGSYHGVRVYGEFDDGSPLHPFTIYAYDAPHYIDLFYYGYCHYGMQLTVESFQPPHHLLYAAWTRTDSIVRIVNHDIRRGTQGP